MGRMKQGRSQASNLPPSKHLSPTWLMPVLDYSCCCSLQRHSPMFVFLSVGGLQTVVHPPREHRCILEAMVSILPLQGYI